jgi:hypothetical protein
MKARRISQYGDPSVMQRADIPQPKPGPDDALVRVHAAGVNYADLYFRTDAGRAADSRVGDHFRDGKRTHRSDECQCAGGEIDHDFRRGAFQLRHDARAVAAAGDREVDSDDLTAGNHGIQERMEIRPCM